MWMAYDRIEPFGPGRADLRTGILASVIANVNRDPKQRRQPYTPADFIPSFGALVSEDDADEPETVRVATPPRPSQADLRHKLDAFFGRPVVPGGAS